MNVLNQQEFTAKFGKNGDATIINVLDEEMFRNEHIPGSINIPLQSLDFMEQVEATVKKDAPVVVYSGGQDCPACDSAARQLEEAGYKQVYAYKGGLEQWKAAGQKIDTDIPDETPKEEAARTGGELFLDDKVGSLRASGR